jgi:hypothetical protein
VKTTLFLMDEAKRKRFALWGIVVNLMFLHAWASVLIVTATVGAKKEMDGETIRVMFSSVMTGIGVSLLVLISDKFVEFIIAKFAGSAVPQPSVVSETVTRTITPAAAVSPMPAQDVSISAAGDVTVSKP